MITIEQLKTLAGCYEADLREYRLSGDLEYLLPLVNKILGADQRVLTNEFFNALTNNETIAFEAIREEIGSSGNISVVKMIQRTNLSRPVWTSLLTKMEKYGIAIVKSQGVKGTYIEISKEIDNGNL